ncbi:MAG: signal peptidase I [Akkermansiaceae bacterium]|jgi:signal peptidase I|nr:signal peptidase I [Akkermansiaceae bacterium]
MFTAAWKKNAKILVKGAKKFVDYKRDLLSDERIAEIESRKKDLIAAVKSGDRAKVEEASKQLRATCEHSLPREKPQGWFEENVEVMFVAIVIALGLRAYYLQPFRIPTGSMQPTLNGIVGTPMKEDKWPSFPVRMAEYVLKGRSYVKVVNNEDRQVPIVRTMDGGVYTDVKDYQWFHFFSRSRLYSLNEKPLRLPAPASQAFEVGLRDALIEAAQSGGSKQKGQDVGLLKKGQVLLEGFIDTGDLVLVDKFSYHFRKPERGEVFVFDTIGIKGIKDRSGEQGAGSHYIKRLVGVPGDSLSIQRPDLLVDGKITQEPGIRRVAEGGPPFKEDHIGYHLAERRVGDNLAIALLNPEDTLDLDGENARPGMREYAAMGDNTGNSLDSRYWGTVKEYNLVGPALFSLWPITTGHWGLIK